MKASIMVVGRQLQTKMRLYDPLGGPPTRAVLSSYPVASAREVPPREDLGGYAQRERPGFPT